MSKIIPGEHVHVLPMSEMTTDELEIHVDMVFSKLDRQHQRDRFASAVLSMLRIQSEESETKSVDERLDCILRNNFFGRLVAKNLYGGTFTNPDSM